MKKEYFFKNIKNEVEQRINKENEFAISYVRLFLYGHRLILSNLVGKIAINDEVKINSIQEKGNLLFTIESLSVCYDIVMEERGVIKKIYTEDSRVVMYNTPIILLEAIE
ncbi:hypothetical protein ATZ33_00165 [Enterococcus silesiacus]|uniref:Uncharacterized protein n=1 Tax=Enterococcus silesiacus TaxID=332949 RepID=A0A0S3K6E3_9ENTE|nr:hypothetical protein [Enterococcus silesiacus]ALR99851.1 hypothetical protein ATZ33_00165 [Enterococcus silesiacus]OJG92846.1 hypothetical protein RV15_GL002791 [Enterococcus silesiacus]